MKQTTRKKKTVKVFGDLKRLLQEALAYEQRKKGTLRVTDVLPPPKPLTATQIRAIRQSFKVSHGLSM
jgi:DNA-binding transcriptional regulator YiaG